MVLNTIYTNKLHHLFVKLIFLLKNKMYNQKAISYNLKMFF